MDKDNIFCYGFLKYTFIEFFLQDDLAILTLRNDQEYELLNKSKQKEFSDSHNDKGIACTGSLNISVHGVTSTLMATFRSENRH